MIARAREEGLRCEGVISVAFGCPYEGEVPRERVLEIARRLVAAGCEEIAFGDTTGMANPVQVERFFDGLDLGVELTGHFHNTRGQGLANVVGALRAGVRSFESSFGELGGCPVPPGATGNIATEDLVSMLHEMGYETGIDLARVIEAAREAQDVLGRPLGSHVLTAGPGRVAARLALAVATGAASVLPGFLVGALALQIRADLDVRVEAVAAGVSVFFLAGRARRGLGRAAGGPRRRACAPCGAACS